MQTIEKVSPKMHFSERDCVYILNTNNNLIVNDRYCEILRSAIAF